MSRALSLMIFLIQIIIPIQIFNNNVLIFILGIFTLLNPKIYFAKQAISWKHNSPNFLVSLLLFGNTAWESKNWINSLLKRRAILRQIKLLQEDIWTYRSGKNICIRAQILLKTFQISQNPKIGCNSLKISKGQNLKRRLLFLRQKII